MKSARSRFLGVCQQKLRKQVLAFVSPGQIWGNNKTGEQVSVHSIVRNERCGCGAGFGPRVYLRRERELDWYCGLSPEYFLAKYTYVGNPPPTSKFLFPIRRRLLRPQWAKPLVSIQPKNFPQGLMFFTDFAKNK